MKRSHDDANKSSSTPASETMPSLVCAMGGTYMSISDDRLRNELNKFLDRLGPQDDVFIVPPDFTRFHSQAGRITELIAEHYQFIPNTSSTSTTTTPQSFQIMPALGTHAPMTQEQIQTMFGTPLAQKHIDSNETLFQVHDWRNDVVTIGHVPAEMVETATRGMVRQPWPAQLNKAIWEKRNKPKSVVLSIGQVVPHEVMGMANFNKNMFVGVGGVEAINLSHFIGAVYGMEQMMGRAHNPLRAILNHASERFLQNELNVWYILTVVAPNPITQALELKGLYIGNSIDCYNRACELSMAVNFTMLDHPTSKMVVYLDPDEFHSTWLGNKSIYRTRMAMADGGELIVLAPGVKRFGEDDQVDKLIRKYGYVGTPQIMEWMDLHQELKDNLSAVAHLIHGSSEGRFRITYCPGHLTKDEVEGVGFKYADLEVMSNKYNVNELATGWHAAAETNEEFFFIKNPALGLWAVKSRFEAHQPASQSDT
ncbi:DUF2088 domain containing protein [Nitzschia inconspicua]|uniref:DUF2088 domain containing protein n=1 Tax=Nitzschia inconspicua TaxID=303405 RepID=A0A9K3KXD0_9STRA|nr:DUF2088 domain containing protein [Nitzschia inconspicua]